MFQDLSSSPVTMPAGKACDAYGMISGLRLEQAGAVTAHTQSLFGGVQTSVRLPKDPWQQKWIDGKMGDTVCLLALRCFHFPNLQPCRWHLS